MQCGCGMLGWPVGRGWRRRICSSSARAPWDAASGACGWRVTRERASSPRRVPIDSHPALREDGMIPRLRSDPDPPAMPYLLFSVPPSSQEDYAAEAARAASLWPGEGACSSPPAPRCTPKKTGDVAWRDPLWRALPGRCRLRDAEERLLAAGALVVRLAGLYDQDRGPHRVYLRNRTSSRRPDGLVSLIHYDDAASCAFGP